MTKFMMALALAVACTPALAQKKMYRCGNIFQERPCEGPKADVGKATPAAAAGDPQKDAMSKREEKENKIREAKCESFNSELDEIRNHLKTATSDSVKDQLQRRQREMDIRVGRECKKG